MGFAHCVPPLNSNVRPHKGAAQLNPSPALVAVIKVVALLAAPLLWAGATHQRLGALWPGQVTVNAWRAAATAATLVFGALVIVLLWRSRITAFGKVLFGLVVLGFFGVVAINLNLRSSCAPSAEYIGEAPRAAEVASCQ
ncbi:hypothetical protein GCM10007918_17300 [Piscinibacter gummiphilus]|nr:hypothetical protein GCM10007918_17300 [Piscinibacter gummiphilus]